MGQLPKHFDVWILISEIFLLAQNYHMTIICLNIACDLVRGNPTTNSVTTDGENPTVNTASIFTDTYDYNNMDVEKTTP